MLLALGSATGFLAGLLGIGGGMLLVPFLTMLFSAQAFPQQHILHMAVATSLTTILFTSVSSVRAHRQRGAVRWDVIKAMAGGAFLGTFLGAQLASLLHTRWLATFFAVFVGFSGVAMLRSARRTIPAEGRPLFGRVGLFGAGSGIGFVASLVGAGGGFITIPLLTWCRVRIHEAVATSAAMGFPIAAGGLVGYVISGWNVPGLPPLAVGFIYLPALAVCAIASMLTAPFGARVAHRLDVMSLKKIFAMLLIGLAVYMAWKAYRS